tara:strand:+ start:1201 stop:1857 length:657 start_codon:yes stop_codon:yes gene_type:complete
MSFDGTIQLLGPRTRASAAVQPTRGSQLAQLQRIAPGTFRLDLGGSADGPLRLQPSTRGTGGTGGTGGTTGPLALHRPATSIGAPVYNAGDHDNASVTFALSRRIARLLFISQVLIVFILGFMVFSLLFFSWRLHYNANWAYSAVQPYVFEFSNHSMEIMRHAHNSTAALENVMVDGQTMSASAVPALAHSLNNTVAMVDRMQQIAAHPTLKLSLDSE